MAVLALSGCGTSDDTTDASSTSSGTTSSSTNTLADAATTAATSASTDATTTAQTVTDTAAAADVFLATLSEEQREQVVYDYDDETTTTSWSNFPVTFVERAGLNLADLTEEQ